MRTAEHRRELARKKPKTTMREQYERSRGPAPLRRPLQTHFRWKTFFPVAAVLLLVMTAAIAYPTFIKPSPKIGYVNLQVLAEDLGLLRAARHQLKESRLEEEQSLLPLYQKLGVAIENWEIKQAWVSKFTLDKLNREIQQRQKELAEQKSALEGRLFDLELKLKAEIKDKLQQNIKSWAAMNGYDVIHPVFQGNEVLKNIPELDVTDLLQKDLLASR